MNKRGQIALYVIIALLIVAAIGAVVYIKQKSTGLPSPSDDIKAIRIFVGSCLDKTAEDALMMIGLQGGYYIPPAHSFGTVAYYYYEGQRYFPEKSTIENQLGSYVSDNLGNCIKDFKDFPDFSITKGAVSAKATILEDKVIFDIDYPLTITRMSTSQVSKFSTEIPSRIYTIYRVAALIMAEQMDSDKICISCIIDHADENEVYVSMENYNNDTVVFSIQDSKLPLVGDYYEFNFVNKYK